MLQQECAVRSLLLGALFMTTLSARSQTCSQTNDSFNLIQSIRHGKPSWAQSSGTSLYTPTEEDYKMCPGPTMICMRKELEMLLKEWNIPDKTTQRILRIIKKQTPQNQNQTSSCVPCEHFREAPAEAFLDFLYNTFQQINSKCNTTMTPSSSQREGRRFNSQTV